VCGFPFHIYHDSTDRMMLVARISTLAPHFGVGMTGAQNEETEMVPIVGLDNSDMNDDTKVSSCLNQPGFQLSSSFMDSQPPALVSAISKEMDIDPSSIIGWELELFDAQPAQLGGLNKEFIFACRLDDKLCSWAAVQALICSSMSDTQSKYKAGNSSGIIKLVATFDNEEIGSTTRQGARSNLLNSVITRITESLQPSSSTSDTLSVTYANSFLVSADVTHAGNPNFLGSYMADHTPRLNTGIAIKADAGGHMTTDSVSTAIFRRTAEKSGNTLQVFMAPGYGGGTIGPMISAGTGVRAVDVGIPQLSMHSVRATTGNLDPGLGVMMFKGFLDEFESVDKEFDV
jgi:aminopeptidase I